MTVPLLPPPNMETVQLATGRRQRRCPTPPSGTSAIAAEAAAARASGRTRDFRRPSHRQWLWRTPQAPGSLLRARRPLPQPAAGTAAVTANRGSNRDLATRRATARRKQEDRTCRPRKVDRLKADRRHHALPASPCRCFRQAPQALPSSGPQTEIHERRGGGRGGGGNGSG